MLRTYKVDESCSQSQDMGKTVTVYQPSRTQACVRPAKDRTAALDHYYKMFKSLLNQASALYADTPDKWIVKLTTL